MQDDWKAHDDDVDGDGDGGSDARGAERSALSRTTRRIERTKSLEALESTRRVLCVRVRACVCVCRVLLLLLLLRVDCVIFALNNLAAKCFMRRRQQSSSSSSASRAEADCAFAS